MSWEQELDRLLDADRARHTAPMASRADERDAERAADAAFREVMASPGVAGALSVMIESIKTTVLEDQLSVVEVRRLLHAIVDTYVPQPQKAQRTAGAEVRERLTRTAAAEVREVFKKRGLLK